MARGFGAARFLSASVRRTGNAAVLAIDAIQLPQTRNPRVAVKSSVKAKNLVH
jgi:hypothetical protein